MPEISRDDGQDKKSRFHWPSWMRRTAKSEANPPPEERVPEWHQEYLKLLKDNAGASAEMSKIYFALTRDTDWKQRFETSLKDNALLSDQLEMLINADVLQQLNHKTILAMLPHLLENERNFTMRRLYHDPNQVTAFDAIIKQMKTQPGFTEKWYDGLAKELLAVKQNFREALPISAENMQKLFEQSTPVSFQDSAFILFSTEYEMGYQALAGKSERAIEQSKITEGVAVKSEKVLGKDGVMVKIRWNLKPMSDENPAAGLRVVANDFQPRSILDHEMVHCQPEKVLHTDDAGTKTMMQGFTRMKLTESGTLLDGRFWDELPRTAFEEGTVVLFEYMVKNDYDFGKAVQALEDPVQTFMMSKQYKDAALIIADLVTLTNLEELKKRYTASDLTGWLEYLKGEVGEAKVQVSIDELDSVGLDKHRPTT